MFIFIDENVDEFKGILNIFFYFVLVVNLKIDLEDYCF